MNDYELAETLLHMAQTIVARLRYANDDSQYGLLESCENHIIHARGDLDADLK